jgi:hypothetical protein
MRIVINPLPGFEVGNDFQQPHQVLGMLDGPVAFAHR